MSNLERNLELARVRIEVLEQTAAKLLLEHEYLETTFGTLIADYEDIWARSDEAGRRVESLETEQVRAGRPRRLSLYNDCRRVDGRRLLIPFTPATETWEPEGYTPESTEIRKQMIDDFQHLVLLCARYPSAKRRVMDLEEEQMRVASRTELEKLRLQYLAIRVGEQ